MGPPTQNTSGSASGPNCPLVRPWTQLSLGSHVDPQLSLGPPLDPTVNGSTHPKTPLGPPLDPTVPWSTPGPNYPWVCPWTQLPLGPPLDPTVPGSALGPNCHWVRPWTQLSLGLPLDPTVTGSAPGHNCPWVRPWTQLSLSLPLDPSPSSSLDLTPGSWTSDKPEPQSFTAHKSIFSSTTTKDWRCGGRGLTAGQQDVVVSVVGKFRKDSDENNNALCCYCRVGCCITWYGVDSIT